jgi:hypothetical protein
MGKGKRHAGAAASTIAIEQRDATPRRSTVALARNSPMPRPEDFVLIGLRPA